MIFPNGGPIPRHPSEIYEALLEGVVLFAAMLLLARQESVRARFGVLSGAFLAGYAIARSVCELFREPDVFLGYLIGGVTMGQLLCIPMLIAGGWLILRRR
jgi:phosphatidylglycerol:prolipoprotein diacylglycerol transferase